MLTPRKHLNALKFLLEKEIFHKGAVDTVQSIFDSPDKKVQGKNLPQKEKEEVRREPGQQSLFDVLKGKAKELTGEKMRRTKTKRLVTTKMITQQKKKKTMPLKVKKK